jgi:hypothetical protein
VISCDLSSLFHQGAQDAQFNSLHMLPSPRARVVTESQSDTVGGWGAPRCALSFLALDSSRGEVCVLCAIGISFTQFSEGLPPRLGVAGQCGIRLSKNGRSQRAPGRTHAHRSNLLLTVRPCSYAWELTVEGVIKPLCIIMNSLPSPRDDEAGSVERVQVTRVLSELVAASRNLRFGGRPSSAVRISQRRHVNRH